MTYESKTQTKHRAFLVDDDKDTLIVLAYHFEQVGVEVVKVNNSATALDDFITQTMSGGRFDIVVLDIRMPQIDGNELARQIREKGYTGPLIALTAVASGGGRRESKDSGFDYYFGKRQLKKEVILALLNRE